MARLRQQNVSAAQWAPNGSALGAPDLTSPDNQLFGSNVFSPAVQRQRLPKDVFRMLSKTLAKGDALDTSTPDAVASISPSSGVAQIAAACRRSSSPSASHCGAVSTTRGMLA